MKSLFYLYENYKKRTMPPGNRLFSLSSSINKTNNQLIFLEAFYKSQFNISFLLSKMKFSAIAIAAALTGAVVASPIADAYAQLPGTTVECHAACGNGILEDRKCKASASTDAERDACLCAAGSGFQVSMESCLECGWPLWSSYEKYLVEPLTFCGLPDEPTGPRSYSAPAPTVTTYTYTTLAARAAKATN